MKKNILILSTILLFLSPKAQLHVQSGAVLFVQGNAQISLDDMSLVNNGTITIPANGRFTFSGSGPTNISGTQSTIFNELEIAKSINKILSLKSHITVNGKIIFSSGLLDLGEYNVNLGNSAFLENESENARTMGQKNGQLIFTTSLNAPVSVNPANLGAIITTSANLGVVTIRRGHKSQDNGAGIGSSIHRHYDILPANNTNLDAKLRFHYFDEELNGLSETELVLWKSPDNFTWTEQGLSSRNTIENYVEKNRIEDFSRWTLSSSVALPVTGLQLSGRWKNNAADLTWTTLAEYSNDHFEIERKYPDENTFVPVGSKNSAHMDGNSQRPTAYTWNDMTASSQKGIIQYRLKQVDRNGQFSYSNIIALKPGNSYVFIENIYPTKNVDQSMYIQTGNFNAQEMRIHVYDMLGRLCMDKKLEYRSQWLPLQLSSGMYKIVIRSGEESYTNSFIKH